MENSFKNALDKLKIPNSNNTSMNIKSVETKKSASGERESLLRFFNTSADEKSTLNNNKNLTIMERIDKLTSRMVTKK